MRHLVYASFIAIMFSGCINDPETDKTYSLSLPLNVGNKWEYESTTFLIDSSMEFDTISDSNHVFSTITDVITNQTGNQVFEFKDSSNVVTSYNYCEERADGLYLYFSSIGGISALWKPSFQTPDITQTEPPFYYAPASFKSGDEWISVLDNSNTTIKKSFMGIEKVVTKAGTFDCYKFETTGYLDGKRYHYFYPGIGLVKKETVSDSVAITDADFNIVGYQTWISQSLLVSVN